MTGAGVVAGALGAPPWKDISAAFCSEVMFATWFNLPHFEGTFEFDKVFLFEVLMITGGLRWMAIAVTKYCKHQGNIEKAS